ncbi:hypothetical protein V2J09_006769 [Rumex salicifolius]
MEKKRRLLISELVLVTCVSYLFVCLVRVLPISLQNLLESAMAFLANNNLFSQLRSHRPKSEGSFVPSRGFHIELGEREKALLAKDPALKQFKSHKSGVRTIKRIGDVLTIVVVASCSYEIYVRTVMKKEAVNSSKTP